MKTYIKDMTQGRPAGLLLSFMLPMVVGNVFQQMYNLVDSMIVGKYVGADALAAVGATSSLNFLFFSLWQRNRNRNFPEFWGREE